LSIGPMPQAGAHDVIKAAGHSFGPAMRFVADLSDWDNSYMEIVTGESGDYGSEHYKDEFASWYAAEPVPAPFTDAAVAPGIAHTLHLIPAH
jgi:penicillin G amidase